MNSVWKIGASIVVLMGVVAGTAYLIQYTSGTQAPKKQSGDGPVPDVTVAEPLYFPWGRIAVWRKDLVETLSDEQDAMKYEKRVEPLVDYHYDFTFHSTQNQPATL